MLHSLRNYLAEKPAYFSLLRKIIELNFPTQKRLIRTTLGSGAGKQVLDIGCGTGEFACCFDPRGYRGIDVSDVYIGYARRRHRGRHFEVMDATRIAYPDGTFDFILIMAMLHHLEDRDVASVLAEAKRLLKRGGTVLVMEDARLPELENMAVRLVQRFDKGEFIRPPHDYRRFIAPLFAIRSETAFRNGGCTYCSFTLRHVGAGGGSDPIASKQ